MAAVKIHTGAFPSAEGAKDGVELGRIVARWQSVASDAFPRDCSWLLRMVEETDRLRLWERDVDGFTYACRDEFLREKVLIDFDLIEQQVKDLVVALKGGASGGIEAGFRRPMKSVPVDTPDAAVRALMRVFSIDDLLQAVGRIVDGA